MLSSHLLWSSPQLVIATSKKWSSWNYSPPCLHTPMHTNRVYWLDFNVASTAQSPLQKGKQETRYYNLKKLPPTDLCHRHCLAPTAHGHQTWCCSWNALPENTHASTIKHGVVHETPSLKIHTQAPSNMVLLTKRPPWKHTHRHHQTWCCSWSTLPENTHTGTIKHGVVHETPSLKTHTQAPSNNQHLRSSSSTPLSLF